MPRIKQPPSSESEALADMVVAFAETKQSNITIHHSDLASKPLSALKDDIQRCGGIYGGSKVEAGVTTCLIATEAQYNKRLARIKEAINLNIPIVSYDWLVESLDVGVSVDQTDYILHGSAATPSANSVPVNGTNAQTTNNSAIKRPLDDDDDSNDTGSHLSKKAKTSISTKTVFRAKVPVDEVYLYSGQDGLPATPCQVHVDGDGVPRDATLNQTDMGKNANKFYRIQLLGHDDGDYYTWTRWGRVGETGQSMRLGDGDYSTALLAFEKKVSPHTKISMPLSVSQQHAMTP